MTRRAAAAVPPAAVQAATLDDILDKLRASGGRVTTARRAIIEVLLAAAGSHLVAEEVFDLVRARYPDVADSTIYRTLATLEELKVISHVHLGHGPATFHLSGQVHRHLVCRHCHAVAEIPAELLTTLELQLDDLYGFSISGEHFAITGECRACRQSRSLPPPG